MNKLRIVVLIVEVIGLIFTIVGIYQSIDRSYYYVENGISMSNMECICYGLIASSLIISITWIVVSEKK